jgi:hypothetical protein
MALPAYNEERIMGEFADKQPHHLQMALYACDHEGSGTIAHRFLLVDTPTQEALTHTQIAGLASCG